MINFKHITETIYSFKSKVYSGLIIGSDDRGWELEFCGSVFKFDYLDEAFEFVEEKLFDVMKGKN